MKKLLSLAGVGPAQPPFQAHLASDDPAFVSYEQSKLASQLEPGDAVAVSFGGFGTQVLAVQTRRFSATDDPTVVLQLSDNEGFVWVERRNASESVVLHPASRVGQWL